MKTLLIPFFFITLSFAQKNQISIDEITKYIDKNVTVCTQIISTHKTSNHQITLFNIGGAYPNQKLTIVILQQYLKKFNYILVEGLNEKRKIFFFNGKPQIKVRNTK